MFQFDFRLNLKARVRSSNRKAYRLKSAAIRKAKVALAVALSLAASTITLPTAREMYVGCYLLVQGKDVPLATGPAPDPYSAAACLMNLAIGAQHEAAKAPSERRFCIPSTIAANPYREMALAYLDFYEGMDGQLAENSSVNVSVAALVVKWPCSVSR